MASCTLDFQAGNFTCIFRMKSFEDISFKSLLLKGKDPEEYSMAVREEIGEVRAKKSLFENRLLSVSFLFSRTTIDF